MNNKEEPMGELGLREDLKKYEGLCITDETNKDGIRFRFNRIFNGFQWKYDKDDISLSIVLHNGSYGRIEGKFETMCSWLEDVQGHLSFGEVQDKINEFYNFTKKENLTKPSRKDK